MSYINAFSCESLIQKWHTEKDLLRQAELIHELNAVIKDNEKLKKVKWMNDNFLHKVPQISGQTKTEVSRNRQFEFS